MRRKNLAMDDVSLLPPRRVSAGGDGAWDAAEAHAKAKALAHAAQGWAEAPAARIYSAKTQRPCGVCVNLPWRDGFCSGRT